MGNVKAERQAGTGAGDGPRARSTRFPGPDEAFDLLGAADLDGLLRAAAAVRDAGHPDVVNLVAQGSSSPSPSSAATCATTARSQRPRAGSGLPTSPPTKCWPSPAPANGRGAGRPSSPSVTSRSSATGRRAKRSPASATRPPSTIWWRCAGSSSTRPALLPHVNPGVLTEDDARRLREVSVSAGIMLESASSRLCERGGVPPRLARQAPPGTARDPAPGRGAAHPDHDRDPHRDRGDAARTHRVAPRHPCVARTLRPHSGDHRPELPGEAGHPDGGCTGAGP